MSVLSFIPVYFLSLFKAPSGIISSLEYIFRVFFSSISLWGGRWGVKKMSWNKLDTLCLQEVKELKEFEFIVTW